LRPRTRIAPMILRFHGAAKTVTGSRHLIEANGSRILLDCGLYQGRRLEAYERNRTFPFDPAAIDVVVLSHAHIDHSGALPALVKAGFHGRIIATPATRALCAIMLPDSAHIQEKDVEFLRKKKHAALDPLYTQEDAAAALKLFVDVPKGQPFPVADGIVGTFHEAGHMLGSAGILLEIEERGRTTRLGYSGDVGHTGDPLMPPTRHLPDPDVLILESTYGYKVHPPPEDRKEKLLEIVQRTARRGGKLVVPAFSVGRTQTLVFTLNELVNEERLPAIPIYVDSPLSANATHVFRRHPEEIDPHVFRELEETFDTDPFGFYRLTYIRTVDESKALNEKPGPFAIISASGMCEAGRIVHHLHNTLGDPRNLVLIVGFQAPHTLGRRLVEGAEVVRVLGETIVRRAEVEVQNGFSAHGDREELARYARGGNANGRLKRIFLVHGEEMAFTALAETLRSDGFPSVHVPDPGEAVEL
jgi:metallo-beta-lactamase family protein